MRANDSRQEGFTLVELLVSLALLFMMFGYVYGAINSFRHIKRVEQTIARQSEVAAVQRHFRQTIAGAQIVFVQAEGGDTRLMFDGQPQTLILASRLDDRLVRGGLHWLRYRLAQGERRIVLDYAVRRQDHSGAATEILLEHVKTLSFRYFGASEQDGQLTWSSTWPRTDALPLMIEVKVEMEGEKRLDWPTLTIPIEASR